MARPVVSRTQRRMEKKQALTLLFLILAVSLVSFSLGIIVGRSGTSRPAPAAAVVPAPHLPVATAPAAPAAQASSAAPAASPAPAPAQEKLTFYDTLPKGEQPPLGSGINLPPKSAKAKAPAAGPAPSSAAVAPAPSTAAVRPQPAPAAAGRAEKVASPPAPAPAGAYLVQVASFHKVADARTLKQRLAARGYAAFTREADLGAKGIWHRVFIGPFADRDAAGRMVRRLKEKEKLSAMVRKR